MAGKKAKKPLIFIRVLQNGKKVAELEKPLSRQHTIHLSAAYEGELCVPYYPLTRDIELIKTKSGAANLVIDYPWSGFICSKGKIESISNFNRTGEEFHLAKGDYGTVCNKDLRVMFRIDDKPQQRTQQLKRNYQFNAKAFSLLVDNKIEGSFLAISTVVTALLFLIISSVISLLPDSRPDSLEELDQAYTLPFVNGQHLVTAPEALQENLDRSNIVPLVMIYYRNLTETLMGWGDNERFIDPFTVEKYKNLIQRSEDKIYEKEQAQIAIDAKIIDNPGSQTISFPTVKGESLQQRLVRMLDKINILHKKFEITLNARRKVSKAFRNDDEYDYYQYKDVEPTKPNKTAEHLALVARRGRMSNEELMYREAEFQGKKAQATYEKILGKAADKEWLTYENVRSIVLNPGTSYASFTENVNLIFKDQDFEFIQASEFGMKEKRKIKEPLIGKVDPNLIQKIVNRNRFQLQLCYELALRRDQKTKGSMHWQWRIDSRGVISDIALLQSSIKDRRMINCIKNKMSRWNFPKPQKGSVQVSQRFVFGPRNG